MSQERHDPPPRRGLFYGWYVIGAMFFMVMVGVGPRQGLGLFFAIWTHEFGVSVATLSAIAAAGWVASGTSQLIAGGLSDRFGGRIVMSISMLVMGVGTVAVGLSGNVWVFALFYVGVLSFAVGGAIYVPATPVVTRWFRRRRGAALGVLSSGASAGGMLLIPFMAYMLILVDWRITWMILGAMMVSLSFPLLLIVVRNSPRDMGLWPDGDPAPPDVVDSPDAQLTEQPGPLAVSRWRSAYRSAPMWELTFAYMVCGVSTATIAVHFVPFAVDQGISTSTAALAFGLLSLINMLSVILIGVLSDRLLRKNVLAVAYAVRGLAFVGLVLMPASVGIWVFALLAGASWLATVPQTSSLTAEIYGIRKAGTLVGMLSMLHQFGGAAAVLLAGTTFTLLDTYVPAFLTAAALLGSASVVSWLVKEKSCSVRFIEAGPAGAGGRRAAEGA